MWNERLAKLIDTYQSAVLSIVENDGYPASIRCHIRPNIQDQVVIIPDPPALIKNWRGRACLLFHEHDPALEALRQLVVLGELKAEDGILTFSAGNSRASRPSAKTGNRHSRRSSCARSSGGSLTPPS